MRPALDERIHASSNTSQAWASMWTLQHILLSVNSSVGDSNLVLNWGVNHGFLAIMASKLGFAVAATEANPATHQQFQHDLWLNCGSASVHVFNLQLVNVTSCGANASHTHNLLLFLFSVSFDVDLLHCFRCDCILST
jgi:hypothetical protein